MKDTEISLTTDQLPQQNHMKSARLEDSLFSKDLAPHYMQLAAQLAKSEMVPKIYRGKPQDLFVAMAMGYQIGLSVEQSIQAIAVINGKPCLWGDDMLALCMNHPDFVDNIEEPIVSTTNQVIGYRCTVKRRNMADYVEEFDLNKAKRAGLLGKPGVWTQYPERMMQLRARGYALRNRFPDALKGIKSREEVEDYVDVEYSVSRTDKLKNDVLTKKGKLLHDQSIERPIDSVETAVHSQETEEDGKRGCVDQMGKETALLHLEIEQLIVEKQFTEDRVKLFLEYYDATNIEDLSIEQATHFIKNLIKI